MFALWALWLAGCAGGGGSALLGMLVALVMSVGIVACGSSDAPALSPEVSSADASSPTDGAVLVDTTPLSDADGCDGAWEACCVDGVVTTCCCENMAECNYGMFVTCGDGSCGFGPDDCAPPEPDATTDTWAPSDVSMQDATPTSSSDVSDAAPGPSDAGTPEADVAPPEADVAPPEADAAPPEADVAPPEADVTLMDAESCDGEWQTCCEGGVVSTCCCPEGMACNYGWMDDCGDGTCVYPPETCSEPEADVVEPADVVLVEDAGPEPECDGTWQTCCVEGELDQCCCPEGAVCNFWFQPCPDGGCTFPGEPCTEPEPQCDGAWETCCVDGDVDQCCCPEGMACNYGDFIDCGDDTCVGPMDTCAEPEPECDGTWQSCCVDGVVDQCCCPEGMACNYGWYNDCGDGTCVGMPEECKESQ